MTNKDKQKISVAVLCCFLVAFVALSALKFSGIFVFERALSWKIFDIINNKKWLLATFIGFINCVATYCFCFMLNDKPYSKIWWHYIIIFIPTFGITFCRIYLPQISKMDIIYDILNYVVLPMIFALIINKHNHKINIKILLILFIILMYFCWVGLSTFSIMLIDSKVQEVLTASNFFLATLEVNIGLVLILLTINFFLKYINEKGGISYGN